MAVGSRAMAHVRRFGHANARRAYSTAAPRAIAHVDGNPVLIHNLAKYYYNAQAPSEVESSKGDGSFGDLTGFRVWESAEHLITHLDNHRALVQDRTVIELGAGTGAVGLVAAALAAKHVVLSDAESEVTLDGEERSRLAMLADNIHLNGENAAAMSVEPLRWGDQSHLRAISTRWPTGFETIVASDCLYSPRSYDALEATILGLAAADCHVVLSYPVRNGEEEAFVERMAPALEVVSSQQTPGQFVASKALCIVELRRRGVR